MTDQALRDIEAELRRIELVHDESERQLQRLTLASDAAPDESGEANKIERARVLQTLKIRRLRPEWVKSHAG